LPPGTTPNMPPPVVEQILQAAVREKRKSLLEPESKEMCRAYEMPTPGFSVARSASEAVQIAEKVSFPIALKIVSRDILHKSEAKGVLLDLSSKEQVELGYQQIIDCAKAYKGNARLEGVLVQHMAPNGIEIIVGGLRDSQF
jgi:acyl-CoA synthetase (NDP forming)